VRGNTDAPRGNNHWCVAHLSLIHSGTRRTRLLRTPKSWNQASDLLEEQLACRDSRGRGFRDRRPRHDHGPAGDYRRLPMWDYSHTEAQKEALAWEK